MQVDHEKIKQLRQAKGITYKELGTAADLSDRRIRQIEDGDLKNLNLNIAKAIARKLGVKLEEIAK